MFGRHGSITAWVVAGLIAGCSGGAVPALRSGDGESRRAEQPVAAPPEQARVTAPDTSMDYSASPDSSGALSLQAGDLLVSISAPACRDFGASILACDDVALSVLRGGRTQAMDLESLYINTKATLFRGDLDARDRTRSHSIVLADVNLDAHDDLLLWTGRDGGYGGASYSVHLFEPSRDRFVYSQAFSDLTVGRSGLFTLEDRRVRTGSKSGCCIHIRETFVVEKNAPVLVERIEEDATGGAAEPRITVSRRVNGKMQKIDN
jgi:hypothetical protein